MDSLLSYYPTIVSLCDKLSFQELKSLSLVSKGWYEATNLFIVRRTVIKFHKCHPCEIEFSRNYNDVIIYNSDLNDVDEKLPENLVALEISFCRIDDFKPLHKLKKLKSLAIHFPQLFEPSSIMDLVLGLQSLEVSTSETDLSIYQELIRANGSIRSLTLCFTTVDEDLYEGEFNDFLRNIHLPKLEHVSLYSCSYLNLSDGLKDFCQNHSDLKVCSLTNLKILDDTITILQKNCKKLEQIKLEKCLELTGVTLKVLKLMKELKHLDLARTSFPVKDLERFNPRQLETFTFCFAETARIDGFFTVHLKSMLQSMYNMRVLDLSGLKSDYGVALDFKILPFIAEQMPSLVDLNLKQISDVCHGIGDFKEDLMFKNLEKLNISYTKLTDQLLCLITAPKLRILHMDYSYIESRGVLHIVNKSPLIEQLFLPSSCNIGDEDVIYIAGNLSHLRKLDVVFCQIGEGSFKKLLNETSIEAIGISMDEDYFTQFAKLKEEFEESDCNGNYRGFEGHERMVTNGARFVFIFFPDL